MIQPPRVGPMVGPTKRPTAKNGRGEAALATVKVSKRIAWDVERSGPAPDALDKPERDELPDVVRVPAGDRGGGEQEDGADVVVAAAEARGEEARHRMMMTLAIAYAVTTRPRPRASPRGCRSCR